MGFKQITSKWLNTGKQKGYVRFPQGIERIGLSGSEWRVYLYLLQKMTSKNIAESSYTDIATSIISDRRTVINAVKSLEEQGLIKKQNVTGEGGNSLPNGYELYRPV